MKHILLTILALLTYSISTFSQVSFTARARNTVLVGEKFQLEYSINEDGKDLRLASLDNFDVLMGPSVMSSSSTQIINGNITRSKQFTYSYILKGNKIGKFTIKPAHIIVNGKKYTSNAVTINVVKNQGAAQNQRSNNNNSSPSEAGLSKEDLFIRVVTNKSSVYPGEPLLLNTKIYTRINLDNVSDIKNPDFRNFIVQDINKDNKTTWHYETINNKQYSVGTFEQKVLYAQGTGRHKVSPTEIEFLIKQRIERRGGSVFDNFFNDQYRTVKKRVRSNSLNINVKPFPAGKPSGFKGTVGNFSMEVTTSQNKAKVDDGITIKVVVSGTGNHKLMTAPKLKAPSDFDTFDPTITNKLTNTAAGMKGTKTFEYLVIPRFGGTFTIDPIQFTYFNPATKKYKTLKSKPIIINVEKNKNSGTNAAGRSVNNNTNVQQNVNREDVKLVGSDIRYIKTDDTTLKPVGTFIFGSIIFMLGYIIPIILLLIALLLNRKKIHASANVHLMKNKKANKMATKRLKQASSYLKDGNNEAFYDEILKANYTYLSDKLFLPVSELNKERFSVLLAEKGVKTDTINELAEVLDTCEFARFSPSSDNSHEMDNLYKKAITTISNLDGQIKK